MKYRYTAKAEDQFELLPVELQRRMDKQVDLLVADMRHPSLRAKKYSEDEDYWQARLSDDYRFYFTISGATYLIFEIKKHPK
jgi:mRNA interferase RelE/StbE